MNLIESETVSISPRPKESAIASTEYRANEANSHVDCHKNQLVSK